MQANKYILALILGLGSVVTAAFPALPYSLYTERGQVKAALNQIYGQNKTIRIESPRIMETAHRTSGKTGRNEQNTERVNRSEQSGNKKIVGGVGQDDRISQEDRRVSKETIPIRQWLYREWDARYGEQVAKVVVAIAKAESGIQNKRSNGINDNGTYDWGILQLNDCHDKRSIEMFGKRVRDLSVVEQNQLAMVLYEGRNKSFRDWSTYNSGKYRLYLN